MDRWKIVQVVGDMPAYVLACGDNTRVISGVPPGTPIERVWELAKADCDRRNILLDHREHVKTLEARLSVFEDFAKGVVDGCVDETLDGTPVCGECGCELVGWNPDMDADKQVARAEHNGDCITAQAMRALLGAPEVKRPPVFHVERALPIFQDSLLEALR